MHGFPQYQPMLAAVTESVISILAFLDPENLMIDLAPIFPPELLTVHHQCLTFLFQPKKTRNKNFYGPTNLLIDNCYNKYQPSNFCHCQPISNMKHYE